MNTPVAILRNAILLGIFAAVTATLIAWTWLSTREDIARSIREAEARQLLEIFPAGTHSNELIDDRFEIAANTPLLELREPRSAYVARRALDLDSGTVMQVVGVILPATARDGYSGDIQLLVGVHRDGSVAGVRVVSHRETPGLGDAIDLKKSNWILSFDGRSLVNPSPSDWKVRKDGGVFDQFTGATITPRAVVTAVRKALDYAALHRQPLFGSEAEPPGSTARPEGKASATAVSEPDQEILLPGRQPDE